MGHNVTDHPSSREETDKTDGVELWETELLILLQLQTLLRSPSSPPQPSYPNQQEQPLPRMEGGGMSVDGHIGLE